MSDDEISVAVAVAVADPESDVENDIAVAAVVDDENDEDEDEDDVDDNDNMSEVGNMSVGTSVNMTPTKPQRAHSHDHNDIMNSPASQKSTGNGATTVSTPPPASKTPSSTRTSRRGPKPGSKRGARKRATPRKVNEIPSVKDLGIPFRAIKRIMKVDKDIGTVQNEAAMVATYAVELFVEKIVKESNENAKKRGRNTVKYEDLAEVRVSHQKMNFLNSLLP